MLRTGPRVATLALLAALSQSGCNTMLQRLPGMDFLTPDTSAVAASEASAPRTTSRFPVARPAIALPPTTIPPEQVETDLVRRLRGDYQLASVQQPSVDAHRKWFLRHPLHLQRVMRRAEPFLYLIVQAVEERELPGELALLPAVESGFQPFAYSQGQAAGIWQFIPATGRRFGLRQDWWYDGRRDIVESTRAALDYLELLHRRFDDWLLAIAAYNCGEGNVIKAIAKNRRANRPTDFWSLDLPRETRAYVPRLLALVEVLDQPQAFKLKLPLISNEPKLRQVDTLGPIDLARAAELAELSIDDMYRFNPAFNRWATAPEGPHRLLLPLDNAARFEQQLASLPPEQRMQWVRHRIKPGESLSLIAKRYKTSVKVLQSINRLQGHRIRAGRHLLVPKAARSLDSYTLSQDMRQARGKAPRGRGRPIEHRVRKGDSLWTIARQYGVSVAQLSHWNGLSGKDTLRIGRSLKLWRETAGNAADPTTRRITYTVRDGESLWHISRRFRVSIAALRRWNDLQDQRYLQPGQKLQVYVDVTRQSSAG